MQEDFAVKKIAIGIFALAAGCTTTEPDTAGADRAGAPRAPRIDVLLTDAPGDFDEVWVNISSVSIESAEAGWLTLTDQPQKLDLLTLQNDVTAALGGATLAPGMYGQLRMIVDSASVVVDGQESPLKIASGMETGIKINLDATVEENMTYSLTLDFDAHKSVKSTGQGYLMTPVIQVKDFVGTPAPPLSGEGQESEDDPIL